MALHGRELLAETRALRAECRHWRLKLTFARIQSVAMCQNSRRITEQSRALCCSAWMIRAVTAAPGAPHRARA
jgi:hypothetical protein